MNQKARKWNSLYKRQGNFNVRRGTVELCSVLAGCGVKRAAASAGYIYSDKSLHTLKRLSKVYLFKRQQNQPKDTEALMHLDSNQMFPSCALTD